MKISLVYPKIPENTNGFLNKCIAFEKYDGTNLHWNWNSRDGWHTFGTRRTQFPLTRIGIADFSKEHYELINAPHIFNEKLRDRLSLILSRYCYQNFDFTVFTEFHGPNSFAGGHSKEDSELDLQELTIIDISFDKKILDPEAFLTHFQDLNHPLPLARVIYKGKYTGQFTEDVRKGKYGVNEGVVCKGVVDGQVFMTKIKTKDYLKRLEKR